MSDAAILPPRIRLVEVGLRDGLQSVETVISTEDKLAIVDALISSGVKEIEAVSFAHPRVLPQLADAEDVMANVPRLPGVTYRGLVPNLRGAQRAIETNLDAVVMVASADESMSVMNQGRPRADVLRELPEVGRIVTSSDAEFIVGIACAIFAPTRGPVSVAEMDLVVSAAQDAGASSVYIGATSGMEHPVEVAERVSHIREKFSGLSVGVHLHNRAGFGIACAMTAMTSGADWLEGSFAGLGGDLWFPGDPSVLGNVAMEDLVHFCESGGVSTGIDLVQYLTVVEEVERITSTASSSHVSRGGTRLALSEAQWDNEA